MPYKKGGGRAPEGDRPKYMKKSICSLVIMVKYIEEKWKNYASKVTILLIYCEQIMNGERNGTVLRGFLGLYIDLILDETYFDINFDIKFTLSNK